MKTTRGKVEEIFLDGSARISCPPGLIPTPGQYLQTQADGSYPPLPVCLFPSLSSPNGFRSAPPIPSEWTPGKSLTLRGPIGRGFSLPPSARKTALISFDDSLSRLLGLVSQALAQKSEIVAVCDTVVEGLPEIVEIQPLRSLPDVLAWADYAAMDMERGKLIRLEKNLEALEQAAARIEAQVLLRSPMPCAGIADCGVCAFTSRRGWRMICREGPVFDLGDVI
ncbi:MAG: hypothetical protein HYZ24_00700 [Chloroflexi bacterium]|nr:hypothetical protein [Chloroflexota bacterium]